MLSIILYSIGRQLYCKINRFKDYAMKQKHFSENTCKIMCRSQNFFILISTSLLLISVSICQSQSSFPLIDSSDFQYIGAFRLPQIRDDSGFAYGGNAMTYNKANNSLYLVGHVYSQQVAEVLIPPDDSIKKTELASDLSIAKMAQGNSTQMLLKVIFII
jgi:hypothetical protein